MYKNPSVLGGTTTRRRNEEKKIKEEKAVIPTGAAWNIGLCQGAAAAVPAQNLGL